MVDDNPLHLQRYRENLARDTSLVLRGEFATARDIMAAIGALKPDVALVDLGLPDGSGFDVIRHIRQVSPQTAVMVVSVFGGERNLLEAIEAGATGYLLKDSLPDDFNASIHALSAGESPISPSLARLLLERMRPGMAPVVRVPTAAPVAPAAAPDTASPLSARETSILEAIARGRSLAEIGAALNISPLTVKTHVQNIYRKLEATSRQHAVFLAQQRGLLKL
nr:response regulator transcription factor [Ramlibacter paludis]